jgi:hypothetical protein
VTTAASASLPTWRHPGFRRGAREMFDTAIGIAAGGLITGVAMGNSGLPLAVTVTMSLVVFAGSAQLAVLPLMSGGAPLWVVWATSRSSSFVIRHESIAPGQAPDPRAVRRIRRDPSDPHPPISAGPPGRTPP